MKLHIRLFFISVAFVIVAILVVKSFSYEPSEALVVQSQAIAYFITLAGVILSFSWFKRKAISVDVDAEVPKENIVLQNKVLYMLCGINFINAMMLIFTQEQSVQMMAGISLMMLLIAPTVFRTMQEK